MASIGGDADRQSPFALVPSKNPLRRIFPSIRAYAMFLCALLVFIIFMAIFLIITPQVRLVESIICFDYYRGHDPGVIGEHGRNIPEKLCKVDSVQEELAFLNGFQSFFSNIPGVVLSVPFGVLADKYGRKIILALTVLGLALHFSWFQVVGWFLLPIRLTWLSAAFFALGGGPQMIGALLLMIIADVTPSEQRTTAFLHLQACLLAAELIAPPLSSTLMSVNIRLPVFIGLGFQLFGILVILALPDTRRLASGSSSSSSSNSNNVSGSDSKSNSLRSTLNFLLQDTNVALLAVTFVVVTIGQQTMVTLLQYVSKRYAWSLAEASLLLSIRAGFNLVLLLAGLPALTAWVTSRWNLNTAEADLFIARTSICLSTLGFLGMALSPSSVPMIIALVVITLGSGFGAAARNLATSMVHPSNIARLYTSIAASDTLGALVGAPAMSFGLQNGLRLGGQWVGLPFMVLSVLFLAVTGIMFLVRADPGQAASYEPIGDGAEDD